VKNDFVKATDMTSAERSVKHDIIYQALSCMQQTNILEELQSFRRKFLV